MISVDLALELREAGLTWQPAERDCFAIPGEEFDGQIFSLCELPTLIEIVWGLPNITFHGSSEWALDSVLTSEVVWLPSEAQLLSALERLVPAEAPLALERAGAQYRCRAAEAQSSAGSAADAYGQALLQILRGRNH